jgi:predicted nucleic acid-binding protein
LRVLFDTNILLDVMLDRQPYVKASARLLYRVENGEISGWLCATTVTTLFYFLAKIVGRETAFAEIRKLFSLFEIAAVNRPVLETALDAGFSDYEDAVLHQAARQVDAKAIVTRNARHFKSSLLPVYTPDELSEILALQAGG